MESLSPRESAAFLMGEAFWTIDCDHNLQYHILWPLYRHAAPIEEPFRHYFDLWKHGAGFRFADQQTVRVYVPEGRRFGMKIHAVQTGTVRVKASQTVGRGRRLDAAGQHPARPHLDRMRYRSTLGRSRPPRASSSWTRARPPARANRATSPAGTRTSAWRSGSTSTPEQEVGPQLLKLGIRPDDVRKVILTHLHTDHAGGLHHFPKSEILVCDEELRLAKGFAGRLRGYLPNRWPDWFAPGRSTSHRSPLDPLIVASGSPRTAPSSSCRLQDTHLGTSRWSSWMAMSDYFLAGDTTYTQQLLVEGQVDGVSPSEAVSLRTMQTHRAIAQNRRTVYSAHTRP